MNIDVRPETLQSNLISFPALARLIPPSRLGRPVAISTIHRWQRGLRGVRLEAIRIGGRWYTSTEAFQKFCNALTQSRSSLPQVSPPVSQDKDVIDLALESMGLESTPPSSR